ncbi:putative membrane protein [Halanaerobium saccharolyticum]|uniref:Putative membrane protein n=2 Tax=Halanaerobium saccharolyticum TaxID=43595 RepID=A0A4R6LFR0_9FIRM|nr:putative membrane protein [Halanaerobium saccharolyticum]
MRLGLGIMGGGFSLIFWIIIIIAVIYYFNNGNINSSGSGYNRSNSSYQVNQAETIAKKRYAEGEITKKELDDIINDLR